MTRIALVQGHPTPGGRQFCHALAEAYAAGATARGHEVRVLTLADLEIPVLRSRDSWMLEHAPASLRDAQDTLAWAEHLVIIYPLWLGSMPALLKAFLEQVLRPGFALPRAQPGRKARKPLAGRSARIIVTMGMPAFFYRFFYRSHGLKVLERNILAFVGIRPVRHSIIGSVEGTPRHRQAWLRAVRRLGERAR